MATESDPLLGQNDDKADAGAGGGGGGESLLTVVLALVMNALIALAKSVVAVITGSASMVAEAAHSWADAGNEIFLLIAERRARLPRDAAHPFGYGREAYVWSMFAAFGLFGAGAVVSVWHGISALGHEEPETSYFWAYAVLAIAFVLESVSFIQATRQTRAEARRLGLRPLRFISHTSNPTLRAVFAEDAAALVGLLIAALGIFLHQVTGNAVYDAIGSILVGLLLGVVAIFLIGRNRDFLVGQAVRPELWRRAYDDLHDSGEVERVTFLHLEFVGPGRVFLVAAVDLTGDETESLVAGRLAELGRRLERNEVVERAMITLSRSDARELDLGEGPLSHGGRVSSDPP
jgi:cation diffusion facilitator family transporter